MVNHARKIRLSQSIDLERLSKKVRELIRFVGYVVRDVNDEVGIPNFVQTINSGDHEITGELLEKLSHALGVSSFFLTSGGHSEDEMDAALDAYDKV